MKIWRHSGAFVLAAALACSAPATGYLTAFGAAEEIKLTGCLVRGEDGGYLLTNGPTEPGWQRADTSVTPGAVGTSGTVASIFYWLEDDDDLRSHVGQRVEVEGELKGEIADGEIEIDRKDKWTEITIKADGDTLEARVPHMSVVPVGDGDRKVPVLVRKVDVNRVRMVAASCAA
jgi:hypothetical protein